MLAVRFDWRLVVHAVLVSSTHDDRICSGKQVAVLAIEILQFRLRRQEHQLALDRIHKGIVPQGHRAEAGTVDDDVLADRAQYLGAARE